MGSSDETGLIGKESQIRVFSSTKDYETPFEEVAGYSQDTRNFNVADDRLYKCIFKDFGNKTLKVVSVEVCRLLHLKPMMLIWLLFLNQKHAIITHFGCVTFQQFIFHVHYLSFQGKPFQMRVDKGNGSFYYYGFTYDLLNEFAKQFNFR